MKKNYYPIERPLIRTFKNFSEIFNSKWLLALLLIIFATGCKKVVEETGIIGLCPVVVSTDPMDKAIAVMNKMENKDDVQKNKLEKLVSIHKEIIETNRKSVFFDEFKFRRKLSDLYVDVATAIEPLSATQEKGIGVIENEFEVFKSRVFSLIK